MKIWSNGKKSLICIKYLVFGAILFTIGAQIGIAAWSKYILISSYQKQKTLKRERIFNTTAQIENSKYESNITTSSKFLSSTSLKLTSNLVQWTTSEIECFYASTSTKQPSDTRIFQMLPEKFKSTVWPPVKRNECGIGHLQHPSFINEIKSPWMIFVVKSAPHHFPQRHTVRSTWGSISSFYNKSIAVIFLLGVPSIQGKEGLWQKAIEQENLAFGDILQCDVLDNYNNLPNKVLDSFLWLLKRNYKGTYYTFTDDDCMMRIQNIHLFFDHLSPNEFLHNVYCGFLYDRDNRAIRSKKSKWSMSRVQYSESYYPTFCHGGMYTMKRPLMKSLYCMSEVTNTTGFHLEDVLITGILREKLGEGDTNVKPVTTKSGRKLDLMYYPWDENVARTLWKMNHKWATWNRTLLQYRQRKLLDIKKLPALTKKENVLKLQSFWTHQSIENFNLIPKDSNNHKNSSSSTSS